jgi:hypothetical protein
VRSQISALIYLASAENEERFLGGSDRRPREKKPNYQIHKCTTAEGDCCEVEQEIPSELLLPARMVNRFPFPSAIHINTSVFRSVHHLSSTPFSLSFLFSASSHLLRMIATLFAAGLLLLPSANAFFRLPCAKPILNARVDPIITRGIASPHSHTVAGSNGAPDHKA